MDNSRLGIIFLGVVALVALAGIIWIVVDTEKAIPDVLVATVSLCVGALAGLLSPRVGT